MVQLSPSYQANIAGQIMSISAFLGGFAATFLGTLLFGCPRTRTGNAAIVLAAVAACSFVVSVLAMAMLTIHLHPDLPAAFADSGRIVSARALGTLGFMAGMYALLGAIGVSGWTRGRTVGLATSVVAGFSALLASWAIIS